MRVGIRNRLTTAHNMMRGGQNPQSRCGARCFTGGARVTAERAIDMALRSCQCGDECRKPFLRCLLKDDEFALLYGSTDKIFGMLNVDKECITTVCPCVFEERLRQSEVAVLRAVMQKPMWTEAAAGLGSAISSLLPNLFGVSAPQSNKLQGLELTKMMVQEIRRAAGEGDDIELTRHEVKDAVTSAVSRYAADAVDVMIEIIRREYATVGVDVTINAGAPDNSTMER